MVNATNKLSNRPRKITQIEYLGNFPSHRNSGWSEKLQGVTHDAENWFFTQVNWLWKFPVSHDLNKKVTTANPAKGILRTGIPSQLKGYNHFGDPDHYRGFIFIPVEGRNRKPRIAVFRASSLNYITSYILPQKKAGWVAIHPHSGFLYTSNNRIDKTRNPIFIYRFSLENLRQGRFNLERQGNLHLRDQSGVRISVQPYIQGGTFSSDGLTLFLTNGKARNFRVRNGGIWVFNASSGEQIMKSSQQGDFKFQFSPGFRKYEEPEGITFWELDNDRAPRVPGGQIHAILLDNDWTSQDEFYLKHYRINYAPE